MGVHLLADCLNSGLISRKEQCNFKTCLIYCMPKDFVPCLDIAIYARSCETPPNAAIVVQTSLSFRRSSESVWGIFDIEN